MITKTDSNIKKAVHAYVESKLGTRVYTRLMRMRDIGTYDLYHGPAYSADTFAFFTGKISGIMGDIPQSLYYDAQTGELFENEPEGYEDEETGEYIESCFEDIYQVDIADYLVDRELKAYI